MPPQAEPVVADDDDFDLRGLLLQLWHGKWIIGGSAFIAAGLAFVVVGQMAPTYTAATKMLFNPPRASVLELQEVMSRPDAHMDTLRNEMEVLRSNALLGRVADQLDLAARVEFNPALRTDPSLGDRVRAMLDPSRWLPEDLLRDLGLVAPPPPPLEPEEIERRQRLALIGRLNGALRLRPIEGSRVMELAVTTGNPRLAAVVANTIAEQYLVDQLQAKLDATQEATAWLSERVEELRLRVQTAEEAVETTRADLAATYGQSSEVLRQQLGDLNDQLSAVRGRRAEIEARLAEVSARLAGAGDLGAVPDFREVAEIQRLRGEESELRARENALLASVPDTHPAVVQVRSRMADVRADIRIEAERIAAAIGSELDIVRSREASLAAQVSALEAETIEQGRLEVQLRELERNAEASRAVYENFLARFNETIQQAEVQQADARILSLAEPPLGADAARRNSTVVAAGIGGGLVGIGIVFVLGKLNNTFRSVVELEAATRLPLMASLPRIRARNRREVVDDVRLHAHGNLADSVRNLRTSILLSNLDAPPQVVMVTSAVPGEGKSTTSMLLALATVAAGRSSVIVDCDLRMPSLASLLDPSDRRPGLLSLLEGESSFDDALYVDKPTGLHMLMARPSEHQAGSNAADVLSSQRFARFIDELRARYDLVVLDTPPAVVVTDARIVATLADGVLFAVHWDETPRGAVLDGIRELRSVQAPLMGTVYTLVNERKAANYVYDGYGYNKSKYMSYYRRS